MNAERLLRRLRNSPKLWDPEHEAQAMRVIAKLKKRLAPVWQARRAELEHARGQRWLRTWA